MPCPQPDPGQKGCVILSLYYLEVVSSHFEEILPFFRGTERPRDHPRPVIRSLPAPEVAPHWNNANEHCPAIADYNSHYPASSRVAPDLTSWYKSQYVVT